MATGFSSRSELEHLEGKKISSPGGWSKRIGRWFKAQKRQWADRRLKRQLSRLEKERLKEKTGLSEQRRLYERLFKRQVKKLEPVAAKPAEKPEPVPVIQKAAPVAPVIPEAPKVPMIPPEPPKPVPPPVVEPPIILVNPIDPKAVGPLPVSGPSSLDRPEAVKPASASFEVPLPDMAELAEKSAKPRPMQPPKRPGFLARFFSRASHTLAAKLAREREEELTWQERNEVEKRFWQPYKGVKPNLVKDQGTVFFNWHEHMLILALSLVMCCLAIGLVYVGLLIWQKERLESNRATVLNAQVIDTEIAKSEADITEVKAFNDKLKVVSGLLDNHVYWTNLFTFLEDNTLKEVYYERFSGDLTGKYVIPAVARNLEGVSLQLEVIKANKSVEDVSYDTGEGRASTSTVKFNLGLTVDPVMFTK